MKAVYGSWKLAMLISTINICCNSSYELSEPQVCTLCGGTMLNSSEVGHFCLLSAGHIDGRCCWRKNNTSDRERIIGLDLSNCALTFVDDLKEASTAIIIDLSLNHIVNMSDTAFQGYTELNYMILPPDLDCPGGNASWESVGVNKGNRFCEGQKTMCDQTGQLSMLCPENSLCSPYGPGFFQCRCAGNYYGYKCLREGEFPAVQVFWRLAVVTVVLAAFLWVTQRRKAKPL
ncbi:all-trans retinoic acid-induced differentiation factor [Salarias fasciatus]|uniref:All-trans retinoic acid-induced differentiation factor-like n=1 Tax=Salarias fasciatus TaxID=181472 RepID=A0A672F549_SALFA|nr:all-trans retinoic acid-induced differentiation factor-like [Salarias fasciatus]